MYDADHDGEAGVVAKAAAVVRGAVSVGVASEETVHFPVQEGQGACTNTKQNTAAAVEDREKRDRGWGVVGLSITTVRARQFV